MRKSELVMTAFRADRAVIEELTQHAKREELSLSDLIRRAIREYLDSNCATLRAPTRR